MSSPQPVRGTQSLIGEDADRLAKVVETFDRVRKLFGFKRVEVPVIEQTAVESRSRFVPSSPPESAVRI